MGRRWPYWQNIDPAPTAIRTGYRNLEETMSQRVRMSPVDTAWLRMDSPGNLMMIVGVIVFDGPCDEQRLRQVLRDHLLAFFRFRARVVQDPTGAWWEEDEDFDIDRHLVRIGLPGKGGVRELQKLVAQLAGQALDSQRPLWQFHLVENFDHGHALIVRIHHCIGDGIGLMGVVMGMTSSAPDKDSPRPSPRPMRGEKKGGLVEQWLGPFTEVAVKAIDATGDLTSRLLAASGSVIGDPNLATEAATEATRIAGRIARDIAAIALMEDDTETSLKGRPGGSKVVAWNEPLPLSDVKAVGKALGCSVNDVLLSCAAGAIRGYLAERGEPVAGAELRAMVPVNLRPSGPPRSLGNKFGLVPLLLPIGIEDPLERVLTVRARMNDLKDGYTAPVALAMLGAAGMAPRLIQKQALDLLASKATAVMTNVPGPQHALYLAGSHLERMMFWVPQTGGIGVGISILSYDGGVQFGLVTDKKLCPEPQKIIDRFAPEFETLVYAVLLAPWDDEIDPQVAERALAATEALAEAAGHVAADGEPARAADAGGGGKQEPSGDAAATAAPRRRKRSAFAAARAASRG
jgi:WS/DGAT/MGAT family acyltransferase